MIYIVYDIYIYIYIYIYINMYVYTPFLLCPNIKPNMFCVLMKFYFALFFRIALFSNSLATRKYNS